MSTITQPTEPTAYDPAKDTRPTLIGTIVLSTGYAIELQRERIADGMAHYAIVGDDGHTRSVLLELDREAVRDLAELFGRVYGAAVRS